MKKKVTDKLDSLKEHEYKPVRVQALLSPNLYKKMRKKMDKIGLDSETSFIKFALTSITSEITL